MEIPKDGGKVRQLSIPAIRDRVVQGALKVLVDAHPRLARGSVGHSLDGTGGLREEFARLQVEVNEDKTRTVELSKGESLGCLGFEFRRIRSRAGRWMPLRLPQRRKRTQLQRKLKAIFQHSRFRPVGEVIAKINPILRGRVQYFAHGHSSRCFSGVRDWVGKKIRRHLGQARQRRGFGWKWWSRSWLYEPLGLFGEYRVSYMPSTKAAPAC